MTASLELAPPGPVRVGERVAATLRFDLPGEATAGQPRALDPQDDLVVLEAGPSRPASGDGSAPGRFEMPIVLVPFRTGALDHPGLVLPWTDAGGRSGELRVGPIRLEVVAEVEEAGLAEPADIRGPYGGVGTSVGPWVAGGVLALLALAAVLVWRRARARGARPAPPPPRDGRSPEERAWDAIEALGARLAGLDPLERATRLHLEVAPIVREYLMDRFGIPAPERTTGEVAALLGAREPDLARDLARLLRRCDGVKFARDQPGEAAAGELLALARTVVRRPAASGSP